MASYWKTDSGLTIVTTAHPATRHTSWLLNRRYTARRVYSVVPDVLTIAVAY